MGAIFSNFFGFDILIFIAALFNGFIYYIVRKTSEKLRSMMTHKIYVPHFRVSRKETDDEVAALREEEVLEMRDRSGRYYSLFINITAIFPLLGILGTVVSLLGLVSDMSNVTGNFYGALTSTFWGLIFAIIFKFLDGMIAPQIETNEKSVQLYLDRYSQAERRENGDISPETQLPAADDAEPAEDTETDTIPEHTEYKANDAVFLKKPAEEPQKSGNETKNADAIVVPDEHVQILTSPFSGGDSE